MVRGIDHFKEHFSEFQDSYVLIGGVACYLIMDEVGVDFRATKDLDIVLCAEALDPKFIEHFWAFIKAGGYQNQQKRTGDKQLDSCMIWCNSAREVSPENRSRRQIMGLMPRKAILIE